MLCLLWPDRVLARTLSGHAPMRRRLLRVLHAPEHFCRSCPAIAFYFNSTITNVLFPMRVHEHVHSSELSIYQSIWLYV